MSEIAPARTPPRPFRRKFGTVLSANSPPPPPRSGIKKIKARRVSNFEPASNNDISTSSTQNDTREYTVTFEAGAIGLQLEAVGDSECRVQRFVDGGPKSPGPARMAGKIRPGDLLVQVNGEPVESYAAAVQKLKESSVRRTVTFQSAWTSLEESQPDAPRVVPPKTPSVPGTAKRTPMARKSNLKPPPAHTPTPPPSMSALSNFPSSPQRSVELSSPAAKETTSAQETSEDEQHAISKIGDSDDFNVSLIQAPEETVLLSHIMNTFSQEESQSLTTPTKSLTSIEPDEPKPAAPATVSVLATKDNALSPSRVKQLVNDVDKPFEIEITQPARSSILKTVYKSVVPSAGIVASGSYALGSIVSTKLGEALVGHSSKEFDTTVELKMKLLQELSQAKITVDAQQATIQSLLRDRETERVGLEQELEATRREKKNGDQALEAERNRTKQLEFQNEGLRRPDDTSNSKEAIDRKLRAAEVQADLEDAQLARTDLEIKLERLEHEMRLHDESRENTQRQLEDSQKMLEEKTADLVQTQHELESLQIESSEQNTSLLDNNKNLDKRLQKAQNDLMKAEAAVADSESRLCQLEDTKRGFEEELRKAREQAHASEEVLTLRQDNKTLVQRHAQVERELSNAKSSATQSDTRLRQLEDLKIGLEQELQSAREKTRAFEKTGEEYKILVDRLDQVESELSKAKAAATRSDSRLRQLEDSKSTLERELESMKALEQELESAREKTRAFEKTGIVLSGENKMLAERLAQVNNELSYDKIATTQSDSRLRQLEDSKSALEQELQSAREKTRAFEKTGGAISEENKMLVDRLDQVESELSKAKAATTQSDSRLRQLEDSKVDLERELESMKEQSKAIATSSSRSTDDFLNLILSKDERLAEYSHDLKVAHSAINDLRKDLASKSTALENTTATLEQARAEKTEFAYDITRLTSIVDEATGEKMSLQERLYRAQDKLSVISKSGLSEKETLQKESSIIKKKLEEEIATKDQALSEAHETINFLKHESDALTATVDMLRTAASYSSDEESRLRASLAKTRSELAEAETYTKTIHNRLSEEQARSNAAEDQIRSTDEELVEALADLESARAEIKILSAGLARTEANLEAVTNMLDTLEDEKSELAQRETKLRTELEKRSQELFHDTSVAAEAAAELTEARSEIAELQREILSLESSKTLSQREIEYLSSANDKLSTKIQELRKDVDEKESQLSAKTMELMASKSSIEDLRVDLRQKKDELEQSQTALNKVKTQYSLLSDRLSLVAEESTKEKDSMAIDLINAQDELAETKTRNMDLERLLRSMRRTVADSEARAVTVREQLHTERESRKDLILSADTAKAKLEETIAHLSKESEKDRSLFASLQAELEKLKIDNDGLGKETEALTNDASMSRAAFERKDSESKHELDELSRLLIEEREKGRVLAERLRGAVSEAEELRREVDTRRRRNEEQLRLISQDADTKSRKQAEILESKEKELKDLNQSQQELKHACSEISRLEDSLQRSRGEADYLSVLIEDLNTESATKINELSRSHLEEVGLLTDEKEELEAALRRSDGQIEDIRNQLYAAEEGLLTAQGERERLLAEKNDLSSALHQAEDSLAELELCMLQDEKEISADETTGGDFAGLSRIELKSKCISLQDELLEAESRVASTVSDVEQRARHVRRLEEDLAMMSDEITKLVEINTEFEQRLKEIKSAKEMSDADALSFRAEAEDQENLAKDLEDRLDEQQKRSQSLTEELKSLHIDIESTQQEACGREAGMQGELTHLKKLMKKTGEEKERAMGDTARARQELETVVKQKIESSRRISVLETDMSELRLKLSDVEHERNSLKNDAKGHYEQHSEEIESLSEECGALRTRVTELEVEADSNRMDLDIKADIEMALSEQLEKLRSEILEKEMVREEVASRLAQASRVVASQKESIAALEARALEAERTSSLLSEQTRKLQGTVKKMETSSDTSGNLRMKQLQELERKCSMLDEERNTVRAESNTLRDELRQARRLAAESRQMNDSLQSRVDSLKENADKTKAELRAARTARVNTTTSSQHLESELDSKQMEVDHLKAKVQVFSATIARMKSDRILLQEAALQAEFKNAATHDKSGEISRLKSELHTKSSKLESLSAVYKSQQQVMALSHSLEEQLLKFIEDIILHAEKVFSKVSDRSLYLEKIGIRVALKHDIKALDLAGLDRTAPTITELRSCMDDLSSIIPKALSELSEKREQLKTWKARRSMRVPHLKTPESKSQAGPAPQGVMGAFQQMKRVLNEEVFSPGKARRTNASQLDMEYFHKVIHSLESQIDGLLADLTSANDALMAKDQMFVDLERLVSHHESERDVLEKKLESMNKMFHDMEERLNRESSWKEAAEKELASLREGLDSNETIQSSEESRADAKMAAGRLIFKCFENQNKSTKAACFRQWACSTSAMRAVAQQSYAAAALAQQLETTREKLVILKRHLKKSRRGRDSGLDRILEGYETT